MNVDLAEKIKRLRDGRPIQVQAKLIGTTEGSLRQIEGGKIRSPRSSLLLSIARHFKVPLDWLADDKAGWPPPATEGEKASEIVEFALSKAGLIGKLSSDERDLLAAFRQLPSGERGRLLGYAQGRLEAVKGGKVQ
jgi:transcriptional regulator with XRE-family HTH domain